MKLSQKLNLFSLFAYCVAIILIMVWFSWKVLVIFTVWTWAANLFQRSEREEEKETVEENGVSMPLFQYKPPETHVQTGPEPLKSYEQAIILAKWNPNMNRWCELERCACMGCANRSERSKILHMIGRPLSKEQWQKLSKRHAEENSKTGQD